MNFIDKQIERLKREKYDGGESSGFPTDVLRLQAGEPYEYVLGHTDFLGVRIDLSLKPMIPRPESAFWLKRAIDELKEKPQPLRLADVFSGSGNLGLALLRHLPKATVDISELDPNLKAQIEKNILINKLDPTRAKVITASDIQGLTGKYDAIVAVPPYIPYEALSELDPEMINHEPHLAFFALDDGHEFHQILIEKAYDLLNEGGTLYMEADMDHNEAIEKLAQGTKWSKLEFWPDPYGATPNAVLRK